LGCFWLKLCHYLSTNYDQKLYLVLNPNSIF
jgi:hypothetical protein